MSYASDALIDAQKREIEKLEAENTELRYKVHVLEGGNNGLQILNDSLKVNNDNLRELCSDMLAQLINAYDPKELTEFFDRLHEFGIEVK
jgi:cell division protein FtsB